MLSESDLERFHRDGFLAGGRLLTDVQVDVLRDEMERVIRDQGRADVPQPVFIANLYGNADAPTWQILNIFQASEPFRELIYSPKVIEEVAQLTGAGELRIWHDQVLYKPSGQGGHINWHQDAPYWPTLTPSDEMLSVWVALDDVDEDNGCMRMVPGSHRWGDQLRFLHTIKDFYNVPAEFEGRRVDVVGRPVKKGHVHYHHALTWHGSGVNRSDRPRRAIALHYMTEGARYNAAGQHPMKPYIKVADGEKLTGDAFPLVWAREAASATS